MKLRASIEHFLPDYSLFLLHYSEGERTVHKAIRQKFSALCALELEYLCR